LEVLNFGQIVDHNIQIFGMIVGVTLVVILRRIKNAPRRDDLRGNRLSEKPWRDLIDRHTLSAIRFLFLRKP